MGGVQLLLGTVGSGGGAEIVLEMVQEVMVLMASFAGTGITTIAATGGGARRWAGNWIMQEMVGLVVEPVLQTHLRGYYGGGNAGS